MKILHLFTYFLLLFNLAAKPKLLLVGDSLAEGINPHIYSSLKEKVIYKSLYKRGTTVPYWLKSSQLVAELKTKPDIILVSLGTNDLKTRTSNLDQYYQFSEKLISSGAQVYWIIPPVMPFNNEDIIQWIEHPEPPISKIDCGEYDLERSQDQVHLTPKGYQDWSKCIVDSLPL